jgi:hypothetical protein
MSLSKRTIASLLSSNEAPDLCVKKQKKCICTLPLQAYDLLDTGVAENYDKTSLKKSMVVSLDDLAYNLFYNNNYIDGSISPSEEGDNEEDQQEIIDDVIQYSKHMGLTINNTQQFRQLFKHQPTPSWGNLYPSENVLKYLGSISDIRVPDEHHFMNAYYNFCETVTKLYCKDNDIDKIGVFAAFKYDEYLQGDQDKLLQFVAYYIFCKYAASDEENQIDGIEATVHQSILDKFIFLCLVLIEEDDVAATLCTFMRHFGLFTNYQSKFRTDEYEYIHEQIVLYMTYQRTKCIGLDIGEYFNLQS